MHYINACIYVNVYIYNRVWKCMCIFIQLSYQSDSSNTCTSPLLSRTSRRTSNLLSGHGLEPGSSDAPPPTLSSRQLIQLREIIGNHDQGRRTHQRHGGQVSEALLARCVASNSVRAKRNAPPGIQHRKYNYKDGSLS